MPTCETAAVAFRSSEACPISRIARKKSRCRACDTEEEETEVEERQETEEDSNVNVGELEEDRAGAETQDEEPVVVCNSHGDPRIGLPAQ